MDSLKDRIRDDMKTAMKTGDKARLGVIRLVMAAIKQREVDERIELDEQQVVSILDKMLKQRRESIKQFRAGARNDLAEIEEAEIGVIQDFLPQPLSEQEIEGLIQHAIVESSAASIKDMGRVMGLLKPKMLGKADMSSVSRKIKDALSC